MKAKIKIAPAVALILAITVASPAAAALEGHARKTLAAISATWAVAPAVAGSTPNHGSYTISWNVSSGTAYHYFDAVNSGSQALASFTFQVHTTQASGGSKVPSVTFEACRNGSWNTTTHTCSGSLVTLGQTNGASMSIFTTWDAPIPPGGRVSIRAWTKPNAQNSLVSNVSLSASRDSVRPAMQRNN